MIWFIPSGMIPVLRRLFAWSRPWAVPALSCGDSRHGCGVLADRLFLLVRRGFAIGHFSTYAGIDVRTVGVRMPNRIHIKCSQSRRPDCGRA